MKKKKKTSIKQKLLKYIKAKIRKDFIEQGGRDGRFKTKVVPDKKKKYDRKKAKKVNLDTD
ncbi:MAG: hypothetical protein K8R58_15490 [Bacteroidales bacterium]|nr:hypothetical protein [Bacteroidales bacterium]